MLPSIFGDSNKFVNFQIIDTSLNPNAPIPISVGAGIGVYAGWYVCNGQQWTDGSSTFQVPDLNSFSYQIIANRISTDPDSQGYVSVTNPEIQLIGGAEISVGATVGGLISAEYTVNLTDNSNDPEISTNNPSIAYNIKKLPQIIYLDIHNLYWFDKGIGQDAVGDYSYPDYDVVDYKTF